MASWLPVAPGVVGTHRGSSQLVPVGVGAWPWPLGPRPWPWSSRGLGLGLWGLGLGLRCLGNGLLGGLGRLRRGVLTAFAPKAPASGKLWQQCAGSHRIAASAAPLALAVGSGQVLLGHWPGEQPKVEALVALPFRLPGLHHVFDSEHVLADVRVRKEFAPVAYQVCIVLYFR